VSKIRVWLQNQRLVGDVWIFGRLQKMATHKQRWCFAREGNFRSMRQKNGGLIYGGVSRCSVVYRYIRRLSLVDTHVLDATHTKVRLCISACAYVCMLEAVDI